jgi:protein-disulfide isomerase
MKLRLNAAYITLITLALSAGAIAADASLLKPPPGAKVAIVMFQDLESSECARAYPLVWEAANAHKVPVMLLDFPLPRHSWSFEAAAWARYFDQTSLALGNEFRRFIYANQVQINKDNLQQWVQKFGEENRAPLPLTKDPDGKLAEKVKADYALGQRIGVEHTPTIWVVSNGGASQPLVEEVKDREQLNQMIEGMLKKAPPARPAKNVAPKPGVAPGKSARKNTKKAG